MGIFSIIKDLPAIENWWLAEHLKNILKSCFIIIAIFNISTVIYYYHCYQ